jgi:hypothetical protein
LSLSPFLNIGTICENLSHVGNIPEDIALLHKYIIGEIIYGRLTFKILGGISS